MAFHFQQPQRITLRGWNLFHILIALDQEKVFVKALDLHILGYDDKVETSVTKVKNLEDIVIGIYNKVSPGTTGYLGRYEAAETIYNIKERMISKSNTPSLRYLRITYNDHGTLGEGGI